MPRQETKGDSQSVIGDRSRSKNKEKTVNDFFWSLFRMRHGQGESMLIKSVESLLGGSAAAAAMAGLRCCLRREKDRVDGLLV